MPRPLPIILALALAIPAPAAEHKPGERLAPAAAKAGKPGYRTLSWDDLIPKDWDPMAAFKGLDLAKLKDSDPRAAEALAKMRREWNAAPANRALDGAAVRIPGFVVSLDGGPDELREFPLVPYFGACIHVPPPPANQIIHVLPDRPVRGVRSMGTAWVSGVLELARSDTPMGNAGYVMKARKVEPHGER